MDSVICTSPTNQSTLGTSIMAKPKDRELSFLQMDLTTLVNSITTVLRMQLDNSTPKLSIITEVSGTITLRVKVLKSAKGTFLKDSSIMGTELKELSNGITILISILEVSTSKINSREKVNNVLLRKLERA
jgi:hypothetical protein